MRGLTLLEVIVTIAVMSFVIGGIVALMDRMIHFKGTVDTIQRFRKINDAFEVLYRENIRTVEEACYGWTDAACADLRMLADVDPSDPARLTIWTTSDIALAAFRKAECSVSSESVPQHIVTCIDGYGFNYSYSGISNQQAAGALYLNGYNRTPYSITITSGGNTAMSDTWNSGHLDSEYLVRSHEKIMSIAKAMKSYHLSRLTTESISNPCSTTGGLASNDDIMIPWVWQALGNSPAARCSGVAAGQCGCTDFTTPVWPVDASRNIVNTAAAMTGFLTAIAIGNSYRTDGFGNPVTIGLITPADNSLVPVVPPAPSPQWTWSHTAPYGGTVAVIDGSTLIYAQRVVYAQ